MNEEFGLMMFETFPQPSFAGRLCSVLRGNLHCTTIYGMETATIEHPLSKGSAPAEKHPLRTEILERDPSLSSHLIDELDSQRALPLLNARAPPLRLQNDKALT